MGIRGRQSGAALTIVSNDNPLETIPRLPPPIELTPAEVDVWIKVVNCHAADHFNPASGDLLAQRCRIKVACDVLAQAIEEAVGKDMDRYLKLLSAQDKQTRALETCDTKLRITPHSQTNHRGNKKTSQGTAASDLWR